MAFKGVKSLIKSIPYRIENLHDIYLDLAIRKNLKFWIEKCFLLSMETV